MARQNPVAVAERAALKAELRVAIRDACRSRGDSRAHYEACAADTFEAVATDADWTGWLDYWRGQYKARRVQAS